MDRFSNMQQWNIDGIENDGSRCSAEASGKSEPAPLMMDFVQRERRRWRRYSMSEGGSQAVTQCESLGVYSAQTFEPGAKHSVVESK